MTDTTNFTNSYGAHSGSGYMYFFAGGDKISTPSSTFLGNEIIELCVWYCGPKDTAAPGQNTSNAHFKFYVDTVTISPNVIVPMNTSWTQYCFLWTATPGSHYFSIQSGNPAQYSIWFDDFTVTDTANLCGGPYPIPFNQSLSICKGDSIFLSGNWQKNTGTYYDTLSSINGCDSIVRNKLIILELPKVEISEDVTIPAGTSSQLIVSGGTNYFWNTGETSSTITVSPVKTTTYYVTVSDNNNCRVRDSVVVFVEIKDHVFIPSIFSPNGDGNNDYIFVKGKGIKYFSFIVFDRWGEKVFESNELSKSWDGTYKGKPLNSSVFVFLIEGEYESGNPFKESGNITLIR